MVLTTSCSAEHIKYGCAMLIITISVIFNMIIKLEYVPIHFRRGTQITLFKGKLETWWKENNVVSHLQGACRKSQACVHTSLLLQETVASALENNKKVFVSYFDVSQAFNTI